MTVEVSKATPIVLVSPVDGARLIITKATPILVVDASPPPPPPSAARRRQMVNS